MQHVITVVEAEEDSEVVESYMKFVRSKLQSSSKKTPKTGGFKTTVEKARKELEKAYNIESKEMNSASELWQSNHTQNPEPCQVVSFCTS